MAENTGHKFIERGAHKGKGIAVFTSGGDSQVSQLLKFNSSGCILIYLNFLGDERSRKGCSSNGHLSRL